MPEQQSAICPKCEASLCFTPTSSKKIALKCPRCSNVFEADSVPSESVDNKTEATPESVQPTVVANVIKAMPITGPATNVGKPPASIVDDEPIIDGELLEEDEEEIIFTEDDLVEDTTPVSLAPKLPGANNSRAKSNGASKPTATKPKLPASPKKRVRKDPASSASTSGQAVQVRQSASEQPVWKRPGVLVALVASLVLGLGLTGWMAGLFGGGNEGGAVAYAKDLEALVGESLEVLKVAKEDSTQRSQTNEALEEVQGRISELMLNVIDCPIVESSEQLQPVRDVLTAGSESRAEFVTLTRELGDNYAIHDELAESIQRLRETVGAIEQHLNYSLVELTPPRTAVDRTCVSSIELKRMVVRELHRVHSSSDLSAIAQRLQTIADDINNLAEKQSSAGSQFSVMDFEYEQANRAVDQTKQWLVDELAQSTGPQASELDATLSELSDIERRLQDSFRSSIPRLASTTRERVLAKLGRPAEGSISAPEESSQIAANTASQPNESLKSLTSSTWSRPMNTKPAKAKEPSSSTRDSVTKPSYSGAGDSKSDVIAASQNQEGAFDDQMGSSEPVIVTGGYDPDRQPAATYSGVSAVQIKVVGADSVNCEARASEIARSLGASRSDVQLSSDGQLATISILYAGSLNRVASQVRFGEIEICDSQSRTLFVVAD